MQIWEMGWFDHLVPVQLWPLVSLINYKYVPLKLRVLVINVVALFWYGMIACPVMHLHLLLPQHCLHACCCWAQVYLSESAVPHVGHHMAEVTGGMSGNGGLEASWRRGCGFSGLPCMSVFVCITITECISGTRPRVHVQQQPFGNQSSRCNW